MTEKKLTSQQQYMKVILSRQWELGAKSGALSALDSIIVPLEENGAAAIMIKDLFDIIDSLKIHVVKEYEEATKEAP